MIPRDTPPAIARAQIDVWRRMGGPARLECALRMSDEAREVARAGIAARHPGYATDQVEHALRRQLLGDDLFRAAWPEAPLLAP